MISSGFLCKSHVDFSDCKKYRYSLIRDWSRGERNESPPTCMFVMLNPSTATVQRDDPTVKKCSNYTLKWGYSRLIVLNIFALRSTDPALLYKIEDPIGPLSDHYIKKYISSLKNHKDRLILAWGAHGLFLDRGKTVCNIISKYSIEPYCLKVNKLSLQPSHPLYIKLDVEPAVFTM